MLYLYLQMVHNGAEIAILMKYLMSHLGPNVSYFRLMGEERTASSFEKVDKDLIKIGSRLNKLERGWTGNTKSARAKVGFISDKYGYGGQSKTGGNGTQKKRVAFAQMDTKELKDYLSGDEEYTQRQGLNGIMSVNDIKNFLSGEDTLEPPTVSGLFTR